MKGQNTWSYQPYRPLLTEVGDIYICRVVPFEDKIHFEWLAENETDYTVYCRQRGEGEFLKVGETDNNEFDIENLTSETDYEFFVQADGKKSRVRLARCGESIGSVVNYLHPEDEAYAFSGHYLCSPSLVRHPEGFLLASMDVFAANHPQNLTLIFRSDDDGATWHYVSELMPCFWGKLFIHKNDLYISYKIIFYLKLLLSNLLKKEQVYGATAINSLRKNGLICKFTDFAILLGGKLGDNGNNENHINVPMGIWFADNTVVLKRDINNNYAPAWSLVLSSQFKPLPYSNSLLNDTVADVYNEGAYQTFAQVLARQNMLLDKFNELNIEVAKLNNKIENIESRLNSIGTQSNIDDLHVEMVNFKREISNLLSMYNIDNNTNIKWEAKF